MTSRPQTVLPSVFDRFGPEAYALFPAIEGEHTLVRDGLTFELKLIGSRLLERKHRMKDIVRSRKITRDRTCIYLWKRRHEWLAMAEDRVQS